jgi:transcriptional regulator with XRE-family HTH domain
MEERPLAKLSDQLREAISRSHLSRYEIAKRSEIDESALSKFYRGQRGLSLDSLDRLVSCLKLKLIQDEREE